MLKFSKRRKKIPVWLLKKKESSWKSKSTFKNHYEPAPTTDLLPHQERKKGRKRERERETHFLSNSFHFSVIIFSGTIQREREREREREWRNDRRLGGIGGDEVRAMAVMVIVFDTKASEEATHSSGNRSVKKPHHWSTH